VQDVIREEHEERVEGVAEENDAEHLDADQRREERAPANETEAVAERGPDRRRRPCAERSHAHERQEHEKWDERERVDEESPARSESDDDEARDRRSDH